MKMASVLRNQQDAAAIFAEENKNGARTNHHTSFARSTTTQQILQANEGALYLCVILLVARPIQYSSQRKLFL